MAEMNRTLYSNRHLAMKQQQKSGRQPLVVATAHTVRGLAQAAARRHGGADLVEVRLDSLRRRRGLLDRELPPAPVPWLLTARHPAEGGAPGLRAAERRALVERYLPWAAAIDVELRSAGAWEDLLEQSRAARVRRIVSYHDFSGTPPLAALRKVVRRAASTGADVVKIATLLRSPDDLCTLLRLQASTTAVPLATMGMGPLGKVSRLILGAAGSCLNYGYLDKPQVPGQWPAAELAQRLREVAP